MLIAWNFSGVTDTYTMTTCPDPASFTVTPRTMPAGLAARIAAHGGVQQVELYANTCPDGSDIPIATSIDWPSGHFLLNQGDGGLLCYLDHTGTGLCEDPGVCDFRLADPAAAVCWVLRANDGSELIRCGICLTGEDLVIPPCSSSSSSSASSETPSDSSGSSGSLSSSSGSGSGDGSSDSSGSSSLSSSSGSSDSSGSSSGSGYQLPPTFIFHITTNSQNIPLL